MFYAIYMATRPRGFALVLVPVYFIKHSVSCYIYYILSPDLFNLLLRSGVAMKSQSLGVCTLGAPILRLAGLGVSNTSPSSSPLLTSSSHSDSLLQSGIYMEDIRHREATTASKLHSAVHCMNGKKVLLHVSMHANKHHSCTLGFKSSIFQYKYVYALTLPSLLFLLSS